MAYDIFDSLSSAKSKLHNKAALLANFTCYFIRSITVGTLLYYLVLGKILFKCNIQLTQIAYAAEKLS